MSAPANGGTNTIAPQIDPQGREHEDGANSTEPPAWVPEFEGQRPPFEHGNAAAVTHGSRSKKRVEEIAKQIDDDLVNRAPWTLEYPEALRAYGRAEAVAKMLLADLAKVGMYDGDGSFRASVIARWATAENTAARLREALGLTPKSEAEVARDRAAAASLAAGVNLDALAARGRAALDARTATPATTSTPSTDTRKDAS